MVDQSIVTTETISSSPYYLSSSDHHHHVLTPMLLNGENYEKWTKLTRNNLVAKQKLGFIDGSLSKPAVTSTDYQRWTQTNSMLVGWLYASFDPKVHKVILFVDNAKVLWDNLKACYSIGNASRVHQFKAAIVGCTQDGQEVADHFCKLKVMWDDLDDFEPPFECCCNNSTCPQRVKQEQQLDLECIHQFLIGLDASRFGKTHINILTRLNCDTDMTLDQIYFEVISEERHQTVTLSKEEWIEVVGFAVKAGVNVIASVIHSNQGPCTYCGRNNHSVDTCFQLHGVPEWYTEKNGDFRGSSQSDTPRGRGRVSY